jgi:hypothetical protein
VAEPVRVRRLTDQEGQKLQQKLQQILLVGYIDTDWHLGDCTMFPGTKVELNLTRGWLGWDALGATSKTRNGDIWHSSFTFQSGNVVVRVADLDGPTMTTVNRVYGWTDIETGVEVPADFAPSTVLWGSAC